MYALAKRTGQISPDGRMQMWMRTVEDVPVDAAMLAVFADYVPSGFGHSLGVWAGGNSLDNTIRILDLVPTDWVLADIQVHGIAKGFGHGRVHLWSEDGHLMATGSQSLIVRFHDK